MRKNLSFCYISGYLDYSVNFLTVKNLQKLSHKLNQVSVRLEDKIGTAVASGVGETGRLIINSAHLWWPFTMVEKEGDAGYLYTLVVSSCYFFYVLRR